MKLPRLSAILLSTSLLFGAAACNQATRGATDAGTGPDVVATTKDDAIDRAKLRSALAARRQVAVDRFLAYRDGRVYPKNSYMPGLQHVWLDEEGNLCAAATLISADWGYDRAAAIAQQDNFIRLADVKDGALHDWMLTSGLTKHEIVAIQEPMAFRGPVEPSVDDPQIAMEIERLHGVYTSVDRQLHQLWDESLEEAVDALMSHPELAKKLLAGEIA
jgi:hypothetical protein